MSIVFANNASSLLAASINSAALTIQVGSGDGALFPSPTGGDYFLAALVNAAGDQEIVKVTARSGDLLTVVRGQEGTSAASWTNGATRVELRLTKGTMEALLQRTGDSMSGDLDMDNNDINNARIEEPVVTGGQLVGTALRGVEDDDSNEIVVPDDGSRATAGGSPILTAEDGVMESMPVGALIMWFGSLGSLPTGWQLCDGSDGTPDMRGSFPRGAGGSIALGASGGATTASGSTSSDGGHTPAGDVGSHALSEDEMPAHNHRLRASSGGTISASATLTNNPAYGLLSDSSGGHSAAGLEGETHPSNVELVETVGGGQAHDHTLTMDAVANHSHTIDSVSTVPPYKGVYFIMKVS